MNNNYWQFILGLQHNAQLFIQNKISYYNVIHDWSLLNHEIFLVRELKTNKLLYDSIDSMLIDFWHQNIADCSLYPYKLLFPDLKNNSEYFVFETDNYPIAVFNFPSQSLALVKLDCEKTIDIHPIGDPREFWTPPSTQQKKSTYMLFTLIKLNSKQQNIIRYYNLDFDWKVFSNILNVDYFDNKFKIWNDNNLNLVNNLYLENNQSFIFPLLQHSSENFNLAFSLLQKMSEYPINIEQLSIPDDYGRTLFPKIIEDNLEAFKLFQNKLNLKLIELICHTANNYQTAYIKNNSVKYVSIKRTITIDKQNPIPQATFAQLGKIELTLDQHHEKISGIRAIFYYFLTLFMCIFFIFAIYKLAQYLGFIKFFLWIFAGSIALIFIYRK